MDLESTATKVDLSKDNKKFEDSLQVEEEIAFENPSKQEYIIEERRDNFMRPTASIDRGQNNNEEGPLISSDRYTYYTYTNFSLQF